MKNIYRSASLEEGEFLCMALRDHGIESTLENVGAALYGIGMPTSAAPLVITVMDEHEEAALKVIHAVIGRRKQTTTM